PGEGQGIPFPCGIGEVRAEEKIQVVQMQRVPGQRRKARTGQEDDQTATPAGVCPHGSRVERGEQWNSQEDGGGRLHEQGGGDGCAGRCGGRTACEDPLARCLEDGQGYEGDQRVVEKRLVRDVRQEG